MGASTGSEAALLLGVHYPNLVHGVAALSSDDAAECTIWTFGGQSVPCTGLIPVAKVQGPVFQDCGEYDSAGQTCDQARTAMAELTALHDRYPHELLDYPDAGHGICDLLPFYPGVAAVDQALGIDGTSEVANPLARAAQWPKLLAFLRN